MQESICAHGNVQRTSYYRGEGILKRPKKLWEYKPGSALGGSPMVAAGTLFAGCEDGTFMAIDAATGQKKWSHKIGEGINSSPAYEDGIVFIVAGDVFHALEAGTGEVRWSLQVDCRTDCSPVVLNRTVYFGAGEKFYALEAKTGESKWIDDRSTGTDLEMSPVIWNRLVIMGDESNGMIGALDMDSGQLKWSADLEEEILDIPVVSEGILCLAVGNTAYGATYLALDANTGEEKWRVEFDEDGDTDFFSPAIAGGIVYGHDRDNDAQSIYALDLKTGQEVWKLQRPSTFIWRVHVTAPPCIAGGLLHYVTDQGLMAVDAASGEFKWMTKGKEAGNYAGTMADGVIYYWSHRHNCLRAFGDKKRKRR